MKKFFCTLAITLFFTSISFASVFSDISNHWAQTSILNAYHNKFVNGYSDGTFCPNNTITRAEFITILSKVLDSSISIDIDGYESIFTYEDLPDSHWCKPFYNKLMYYGYVFSNDNSHSKNKGKDFITSILGDSFNASQPITRAEAVSLISYFLDDQKLNQKNAIILSDIESSPLKDSITKFCKTGIIKGYADGTFKPNNTITRAEVTKIISDIFKQKVYFKKINWINEDSIEKFYTEKLEPHAACVDAINAEAHDFYQNSYQLLSTHYKIKYQIFNYKDYMKNSNSHLLNNSTLLPKNIIDADFKENKDGSVTVSLTDANKQKYFVNLILENDKWYINSKVY